MSDILRGANRPASASGGLVFDAIWSKIVGVLVPERLAAAATAFQSITADQDAI